MFYVLRAPSAVPRCSAQVDLQLALLSGLPKAQKKTPAAQQPGSRVGRVVREGRGALSLSFLALFALLRLINYGVFRGVFTVFV